MPDIELDSRAAGETKTKDEVGKRKEAATKDDEVENDAAENALTAYSVRAAHELRLQSAPTLCLGCTSYLILNSAVLLYDSLEYRARTQVMLHVFLLNEHCLNNDNNYFFPLYFLL